MTLDLFLLACCVWSVLTEYFIYFWVISLDGDRFVSRSTEPVSCPSILFVAIALACFYSGARLERSASPALDCFAPVFGCGPGDGGGLIQNVTWLQKWTTFVLLSQGFFSPFWSKTDFTSWNFIVFLFWATRVEWPPSSFLIEFFPMMLVFNLK